MDIDLWTRWAQAGVKFESRTKAAIDVGKQSQWPLLGSTVIAILSFAPVGSTPFDALVSSGVTRLRPVMNTALTTVLGMMPLVTDPFYS